ncbi:hypothetical protein CRUP_033486 [Coryphaenoides rupestris]|nr:hypothetical protein CRUP_033486 [Coryphaenoides rupestris]
MSSDDQLSLNSHTGTLSAAKRKPLSGQERWLLKKQKAEKRKLESEVSSETTSFKQKKTEAAPIISKVATLDKVLGVSTMTSVQKQTIPALMSGRDAVVRSQTGSGKTLAYGIPIVQSLQAIQPQIKRGDGPLALVLVPTREPFTWIVPGVLMGGEKRKAEKARLRKGINILVSTPGRLVDHINHTLNMVFSSVQWLVVDEADRYLARLADVCLKDPVSVQVSEPASSSPEVTTLSGSSAQPISQSESFSVPEALKQHVVLVPSKLRLVCLASFIMDKCKGNKMIVFMASCEAVEFLQTLFKSVLCGPSAKHKPLSFLRLHGNMKQEDVAARGLDLPQVTWIVQYNPPVSAAEYVHRVGRTARIGAKGNSLLFLTPAEASYINELANHNISLSEMKLHDVLSTLMQDDAYKGRGKYHSRTSTSALQQESFLRAYTAYPAAVKHIFHIRALHLGHAAKSFGMRDAPQNLAAAGKRADAKHHNKPVDKAEMKLKIKMREASLLTSEFSSGLDGIHLQNTQKTDGEGGRGRRRRRRRRGGKKRGKRKRERERGKGKGQLQKWEQERPVSSHGPAGAIERSDQLD